MPVSFPTVDTEFAVATGDNVNSNAALPGTSTFDYPPDGTKDLVVTANEGDPDPYLFELGDTYDVSFGGAHGAYLEDAVVIRSDANAAGSGHVVVFEGTDGNGDAVQVVWTPGFDLEQWYWDNYTPSDEPGFYVTDQDAYTEYTAPVICFAGDTLIATPRGPVRAASLVPGALVDTLDHGPQIVHWVGQTVVRGAGRLAPVVFPEGALGNTRPLVLSPQHRLLYRAPFVELMFATPEVLVPARHFADTGALGATIREQPVIRYVHLLFERHEIVMAEGVPCESLFLGDVARQAIDPDARDEILSLFPGMDFDGEDAPFEAARPILRGFEARALLTPGGGTGHFSGMERKTATPGRR